ncbi:MAG: hypothetical protein H0T73_09235 [Ardenticatenales bacterium]|nr:hypothetical protein [Ardenticatenales bacterium]
MPQIITVELSDEMYNYLERTAQLTHQPVNTIIEQSLAHSLSPLLEDIPLEYQVEVFPLLQMNDEALSAEAGQTFPPDRWGMYEALLARKQNAALPPNEQAQLDVLRREADVVTFRKAYAAVLLQQRGYRLVPGDPPGKGA